MKLRIRKLLKVILLILLTYCLIDNCNLKNIYTPVGPQMIWTPM